VSGVRVLVADGRDIFRCGVRTLLRREGDFDVEESRDLTSTLAAAEKIRPDIALVDLDLPPYGGVAAVDELARRSACRIVVWSFDPDEAAVLEAIRAGASGFLAKTISPEGLLRALRATCRGEAAFQRDLVTMMIDALHALDESVRARERASILSAREREVLDLVAGGAANREIAGRLAISEFTVKRHVQNILHKLAVASRREAASFWRLAYATSATGGGTLGRAGT
jgi:DNA-binding NarL/FixJ family response regulator